MKKALMLLLVVLLMSSSVYADELYSTDTDVSYEYDEYYDYGADEEETYSGKNNYDATEIMGSAENEPEFDSTPTVDVSVPQNNEITVFVNDKKVFFDVEPIIINSRTMVPVRAIFEALGATVVWDSNTSTAQGKLNGTTVSITIGENKMYKNSSPVALDSPAILLNNRTLVPARAIAESFDCEVYWLDDVKRVIIIGKTSGGGEI